MSVCLSVCPSVRPWPDQNSHLTKIQTRQKVTRPTLISLIASNSMMAIANCNSGVKSYYWQVCSIQRQVAFFNKIIAHCKVYDSMPYWNWCFIYSLKSWNVVLIKDRIKKINVLSNIERSPSSLQFPFLELGFLANLCWCWHDFSNILFISALGWTYNIHKDLEGCTFRLSSPYIILVVFTWVLVSLLFITLCQLLWIHWILVFG